jgi:hypothetical protein
VDEMSVDEFTVDEFTVDELTCHVFRATEPLHFKPHKFILSFLVRPQLNLNPFFCYRQLAS